MRHLLGQLESGAALIVLCASVVVLLAGMDLRASFYDEGIILTGALEVAAGAVPHRDFYANYGPASFSIVALIFKIFGPSFLAARIFDTLIRAAIVAVAFRLLAGRVRPVVALAATALCGLWMLGSGFYLYPMYPALLLALSGTALLAPRSDAPASPGRCFLAGIATGAVALFRYDVGFFVLLAHAGGLALMAALRQGGWRLHWQDLLRQLLSYGAGVAALFVPAAAVLLALGAGPGFVHDIVQFPVEYYAEMRALPWPGAAALRDNPADIGVYLPFAAVACTMAALLSRRFAGPSAPVAAHRNLLILLAAVTLLLSVKGLVRINVIHLLLAIVPATLLVALVLDQWRLQGQPVKLAVTAIAAIAIAAPVAQALPRLAALARYPGVSLSGHALGSMNLPAEVRMATAPGAAPAMLLPDGACSADFLYRHSEAGERIFSAAMRHDKLFMNDVLLHFASRRLPATHWYHFDPGLQTRADIQWAIIRDLQGRDVRWVVRNGTWDDVQEPNASALSSGVMLLDTYLAGHYRPVAAFDKVSLWLRKDRRPGRMSNICGRPAGKSDERMNVHR